MKLLRCTLVGGLCGLVGTGIWAAIAHFANVEIGWIAWGIGGLVGLGVLKAANGENGLDTGFLAVAIAVVAIVGGKFLATHLAVSKFFGNEVVSTSTIKDENMIMDDAETVVQEFKDKKKKLAWPAGVNPDDISEPKDYPKDVWAEAEKRWKARSEEERQKLKAERVEQINNIMGQVGNHLREQGFKDSFSPMDVLFFGLAIVTAFKFGAGVHNEG